MSNIEAKIQAAFPARIGPVFSNGAPATLNEEHIYDVKPSTNQLQQGESPAYLVMSGRVNEPAAPPVSHLRALGEGYCKWLVRLIKTNRLFFFYEFLSGNIMKQALRSCKLGCLAGDSCVQPAVECFQRFITPKSLPLALRPFLTGGFLPMILFFWLDYIYLKQYPKTQPLSDFAQTFVVVSCFVTVCLFILTGVKCSGRVNSYGLQQRSRDIVRAKPYLRSTDRYCTHCDMIRPLRSIHCDQCGVCVTKYSKHSIFLNRCIGTGNELLYMLLMLAIILTILVILNVFILETLRGWMAFKIFYYFINAHLQLQCIIDALELLIYVQDGLTQSTIYNCTEYELDNWKKLNYLHIGEAPIFVNSNDMGFWKNLKEQLIGMTCGGKFQPRQLSFQEIAREGQQKRTINWNRSLMFHPSHLPNHPHRSELATVASGEELKVLYEQQPAQSEGARQSTPPRSRRGRRYKASNIHPNQPDKQRMASTEMLVTKPTQDELEAANHQLVMSEELPNAAHRVQEIQMVEESPKFDLE